MIDAERLLILRITGPDGDRVFAIPLGMTSIGRGDEATLVLTGDRQVSGLQAVLESTEHGCRIADQGSRNGTYLNDERLVPGVFFGLQAGDVLRMGQHRLMVMRQNPGEVVHDQHTPAALPERQTPGTSAYSSPIVPPPPMRVERNESPYRGEIPPGLAPQSLWLLDRLPEGYQDHSDGFLSRFLAIFESLILPIQWNVDSFDLFLDARTAPEPYLDWMASWYGLFLDPGWTEAQRRRLVIEAATLFAQRGTRAALMRVLEILTGHQPEVIDLAEDLPPHVFRVRVVAPTESMKPQITAVIDACKPVHTRYQLEWKAPVDGSN